MAGLDSGREYMEERSLDRVTITWQTHALMCDVHFIGYGSRNCNRLLYGHVPGASARSNIGQAIFFSNMAEQVQAAQQLMGFPALLLTKTRQQQTRYQGNCDRASLLLQQQLEPAPVHSSPVTECSRSQYNSSLNTDAEQGHTAVQKLSALLGAGQDPQYWLVIPSLHATHTNSAAYIAPQTMVYTTPLAAQGSWGAEQDR